MFVGHTAVALAAKSRAPQASLGTFVAAALAIDLIWPVFLLLGIERVRIEPGNTRFTPLAFESYPWSHSLLMSIAWGVAAALLVRLLKGDAATQAWVMLLVVSHWILDLVTHRPDLPLWPGQSPVLGLGLWNSVFATLVFEGAMFTAGIALYVSRMRAHDRIGTIGFWAFVAVSALMWASGPWASPPPSARVLAWVSVGIWIMPIWAWWVDRHRVIRISE